MIVRKTTPEESQRVNELFAIAFETPLSNCPADPNNSKAYHWAAFLDNDQEMMSTFTISDFQIQFDGHSCKMGGIGGVATLPQYRRNGGIRGCFNAALPDMYKKGYDFSYLFPFSTGYYRKFGYECCVQKFGWEVNLALLNPAKTGGTFRLAEKSTPLCDAIRAVNENWERTYNMMVLHDEEDYAWTDKINPAVTQEYTYVYFDAAGTPKAYTTFKTVMEKDGRNLVCSRFCFVDKEGFTGLMQLFKSLSADHTLAKFNTPVSTALQYLIPEWSLGAAKWNVLQNAGMVRVINVKRVLEKAKYIGSGQITLDIRDDQIPENTGCYSVSFTDGKATSVEMSDGEADAVMTIPAFSALIAGVCDFTDAAPWFNGLEVRNQAACFQQVFYRKPLMIVDYF